MILVAALAIQNAAHRIHMGTEPPTTLMTGTTTQIMIDVADVLRSAPVSVLTVARPRLGKMTASVAAFAVGVRRRSSSLREAWDFVFRHSSAGRVAGRVPGAR
ncbi:DUF1275 family protein [Bradyrhizobium centrolobii]|uniref:DUF1275 family protein n=1 Tax=Bradyrhizobium centrolobii TaxID=1505087 RepID=UPI000A844DC2|nr:DUF1275 family protein [Bradyrhizobium centrolobii]